MIKTKHNLSLKRPDVKKFYTVYQMLSEQLLKLFSAQKYSSNVEYIACKLVIVSLQLRHLNITL